MEKLTYWDFKSGSKILSGKSIYLINNKNEKFIELQHISNKLTHKMNTVFFLNLLNSDKIRIII